MELKIRLKDILGKRNITQAELADLAKLRPNTISEMVKNTRDTINRKQLGKVAKALNITDVSELLYFDETDD